MGAPNITLSIVSHRQNALVNQLLEDIQRHCADRVALVLTENIPDPTQLATSALSCPVGRIANDQVKGFGATLNAAFKHCRTTYFCVVNPDIGLPADPFPSLISNFTDKTVAVAGLLVRNPAGAVEDSARHIPTVGKLLGGSTGPDYPADRGPIKVDWLAGMILLFRSESFRSVDGFDGRYFLYDEDVGLCRRLAASGMKIVYDPRGEVVHDARRASHHNPKLGLHHLISALRFLASTKN